MTDTSRPNVLFIISDQHQQRVAGCYGHPQVQTPHLDALAARGVRFSEAYSQAPLCGPSRASVMTGQYPHTCRAYTHRSFALPEAPTLGSVFRGAGYATGAIGKVHILGETRQRDLGFGDRQMRLYTYWFEDYINAVGEEAVDKYATYRKPLPRFQTVYNPTNTPIDLDEEKMFDALVVDRCIGFMEQHRDEPFFLWAGIEKPHTDWTAPAEFHAMYDPRNVVLPPTVFDDRRDMPENWYISTRQVWAFSEEELYHCIAAYYANVTYMDYKIGQLLAALERLGLAENTIVIYTTDHGEMLFDHGMVQKQNFFEGSTKVPLIVSHPGAAPCGTVSDNIVSLIDLFPTCCDLTGVAPPATLEGRSLLLDLHGHPAEEERAACAEYYEWGFPERMIRQGDWKYMHAVGDICQLYNLREDPLERVNRVDDPACREVRDRLRARVLADWELPDMTEVKSQGPWNKREEWYAGAAAHARKRGE